MNVFILSPKYWNNLSRLHYLEQLESAELPAESGFYLIIKLFALQP